MITMGVRQSLGLFVSPLNTSTGLGIVTVSFALAFYIFGAVLGLTWLATVPPTARLVGIAVDSTGSYQGMWYADIALASLAALVNLPIREAHPQPSPAAEIL